MARDTVTYLARWPCVELLRQYELLRVRCHYEDSCRNFMLRERQRVRRLIRGENDTVRNKGAPAGGIGESQPNSELSEELTDFCELTPRESFNRWLMERRSVPAEHVDPLIPSIQQTSVVKHIYAQAWGPNNANAEKINGPPEALLPTAYVDLSKNAKAATNEGDESGDEGGSASENPEAEMQEWTTPHPFAGSGYASTTLQREILEDLPVKACIGLTAAKTREHLVEYARAIGLIMLAEEDRVKQVSPTVLAPLIDTLLTLLWSESEADRPETEGLTSSPCVNGVNEVVELLIRLRSQFEQQWPSRRSTIFRDGARSNVHDAPQQSELKIAETLTKASSTVLKDHDISEKSGHTADSFRQETCSAYERPNATWRKKARGAMLDFPSRGGTGLHKPHNRDEQGRQDSETYKCVPSTAFAEDSVRRGFCTASASLSKDDVYHTVCLAKPVVHAIYGDAVYALAKSIEEMAQQAAARVAQFAACLAEEQTICTKGSIQLLGKQSHNAIVGMSGPVEAQEVSSCAGESPVEAHCINKGEYNERTEALARAGCLTEADARATSLTVAARACTGPTSDGKVALPEIPSGQAVPSIHCATQDRGIGPLLRDFLRPSSSASECDFRVNDVRWMSCKIDECFIYDGDVEMLALEQSEDFRTGNFRSFRNRFNVKSFKVAQLWARFILKKLGRQDDQLVGADCMRPECVCRGRGWCSGGWTCSCVRKQIKRIQGSAYASEFTVMLFCLLCRYYSVCGCRKQGKGLHSAAPGELMRVLQQEVEVEFELFASPLNVCLKKYCSLFPDIDRFFGSEGSFFDPHFTITEGSYEANPPFEETIMKRVVSRIARWLDASEKEQTSAETKRPLSFCLLVPYWPAGPSYYMHTLMRSKYMRFSTVLPENQHYYVSGFQHFCSTSEVVANMAVCKTFFAVLQNEAGAQKWPITLRTVESIKAAWKPGSCSSTEAKKHKSGFFNSASARCF